MGMSLKQNDEYNEHQEELKMEKLGNLLTHILLGILIALLIISLLTSPRSKASCLNSDCSPPENNGRDILDWGY